MLTAHEPPPPSLRAAFKYWQRIPLQDVSDLSDVIDVASCTRDERTLQTDLTTEDNVRINAGIQKFLSYPVTNRVGVSRHELVAFPGGQYDLNTSGRNLILVGFFIYRSLFPAEVQLELLNKLLHRDLSNSEHNTNVHLHYDMTDVQNGQTLFGMNTAFLIEPLDPTIHKRITVQRMLEKKLRWVTLGGQYDWTAKVYPDQTPPPFPQDIGDLLQAIFPDVDPQAAILNLYSPGDTLSVHRDVSEECDRGLISVSIGCDALFLLGNTDGTRTATVKLRSGDAILMSGSARHAWHAVPKILANTCPREIAYWPSKEEGVEYGEWAGWLNNKRINLNVRQMR